MWRVSEAWPRWRCGRRLYEALLLAEHMDADLQAGISPWNYPMLMAVSTSTRTLSCDTASHLQMLHMTNVSLNRW